MERTTHRVTCKIALFNRDHKNVLLVEYNKGNFGLPGGHLEQNETPDEAISRELFEELHLVYDGPLIRKDFWLHDDGKVILGFVGELDDDIKLNANLDEIRSVTWVLVKDIESGKIKVGPYAAFILNNA